MTHECCSGKGHGPWRERMSTYFRKHNITPSWFQRATLDLGNDINTQDLFVASVFSLQKKASSYPSLNVSRPLCPICSTILPAHAMEYVQMGYFAHSWLRRCVSWP